MTDTALYFWLGQTIAFLVGAIWAWNAVTNRLSIVETKQTIRDKFFDGLEMRAMELLHRDDDKFQLDKLVEKYRLNHYDLPIQDWILLKFRCEAIFEDKTLPTEERLLASLAIGLAEHKLSVLRDRKPLLR